MSKEAEIKLDDGSWEPIHISQIHDGNKHCTFRCGWKSKNGTITCEAPMSVASSTADGTPLHFTEAKRIDGKHIDGCKRKRHQKESRVFRYDQTGAGRTKADYLESLIARLFRRSMKPTIMRPLKEPINGENGHEANVAVMGNRPIKPYDTIPNTVLKLGKFLESMDVNDIYMDQPVSDWILDDRSLDSHYVNGIPEGTIMLVLAKLVNPTAVSIDRAEGEWILADYRYEKGANINDHLFFRLQVDEKALAALKKFAHGKRKKTCYVLVCARWEREDGYSNRYVAKNVKKGMIAFIHEKYVAKND